MTRRLLFVHAHPDDESSKGAATAARYVDSGAVVTLVTCTRGEAGEVLNPGAGAVPPDAMPEVRASELARAAKAIGFHRTYQLGYRDSGYHHDLDDVPDGTFYRVPLEESGAALARILRDERPQVVVTYPEDGGYPHPDHIRTHAVTMEAIRQAADPGAGLPGEAWEVAKVYAMELFTAARVRGLHQALLDRGEESPLERFLERIEQRDPPEPDALIECEAWFSRRDAALRAHVTQIDPDGFWFQIPRELERAVFPFEAFVQLRSNVDTARPEHDLFAGLTDRPEADE